MENNFTHTQKKIQSDINLLKRFDHEIKSRFPFYHYWAICHIQNLHK